MTQADIQTFYNMSGGSRVYRDIWPPAVCVDDFGHEVHVCRWTGKLVSMMDAVITGGIMPGVHAKCIAVKDHATARKAAIAEYHEADANCNTCKHLSRVPHEKTASGLLYGTCAIQSAEKKIYPMNGDVMMFHPNDYMGMKCWEQR